MKYIKQFSIILFLAFLGEILHAAIPLPIPAGIYGLMLLIICLCTGLIKLSQIEETATFLIKIMPLMFMPAIVNLITMGKDLKRLFIPILLAGILGTILVMGITGKITDLFIHLKERHQK